MAAVIPSSRPEPVQVQAFSGRQNISTDSSMFGGGAGKAQAAQTVAFGKQLTAASDNLALIQEDILDTKNKTALLESEDRLSKLRWNLLHDPGTDVVNDSGLATGEKTYGALARYGRNADGITASTLEKFDEKYEEELGSTLEPNKQAVRLAWQKAREIVARQAANHEGDQGRIVLKAGYRQGIENYKRDALTNPSDSKHINKQVAKIRRNLRELAYADGWSPEQFENEVNVEVAKMHRGVVFQFLDRKEPAKAAAYLAEHKEYLLQTGGYDAINVKVMDAVLNSRGYELFMSVYAAGKTNVEMEEEIYASGLPDDVMKKAAEHMARRQRNKAADEKNSDDDNVRKAIDLVNSGTPYEDLPSQLLARIPGTKLSMLRSMADDYRDGKDYKTDWNTVNILAQLDNETFSAVNLMDDKYRKNLSHTEWNKQIARQIRIKELTRREGARASRAAQKEEETYAGDMNIGQTIAARATALKLKGARRGRLIEGVMREVAEHRAQHNNAAPSQAELAAMLDRHSIEVHTWLFGRGVTVSERVGRFAERGKADIEGIPLQHYPELAAAVRDTDATWQEAREEDMIALWQTLTTGNIPINVEAAMVKDYQGRFKKEPTGVEIRHAFIQLGLKGHIALDGGLRK